MGIKLDFYSDIRNDKMEQRISLLIKQQLPHFNNKRIHITIKELKINRSLEQNNLFHLYVGILSKEIGYEFDEMKEILKFKFLLRERVDENTGEIEQYIKDTHRLKVSEFAELISGVIRWAAEFHGIVLPIPDEQVKLKV